MNKKAIIVGSGIAGLASSVRLAGKGFQVTVFERNTYPGGKATEISGGGYRFDAGPSLFTLPHLVDEIFKDCGHDPGNYYTYYPKDIVSRYFWDDHTQITAWADPQKFGAEVAEKLGVPSEQITNYLRRAGFLYDTTHNLFLENSLHKWETYFSKDVLSALKNIHKLQLLKTMDQVNRENFDHPKLVQLFNRYATYNGSSPYLTPGIMSLIPHLEHNLGTFYPRGGIYKLVSSLYKLAVNLGVKFVFNANVEQITVENKTATGVEVAGKFHPAEIVMCNMDIVPAYRQLMPEQKEPSKILNQARSSSALIFYWGIGRKFPELDLHNVFFGKNYHQEFKDIFGNKKVYNDPTVYINITSKEDPGDAPDGCENWFVMINVPSDSGQDWSLIIPEVRKNIIAKLSKVLGTSIEDLIRYESILDPVGIEQKTSSYQGALYGASSNNMMSAFLRHPNFSSKIKQLYFCGGSVHPGGGIPLALLSAKIATELAVNE